MIRSSFTARVLAFFACVFVSMVMISCDDDGTSPGPDNGTPEPGWEMLAPATGPITASGVAAIDPQTVVGVGFGGGFVKTSDGGATWTAIADLSGAAHYWTPFAWPIPEALKKAKPGTKEFRAALRDALEKANVVATHGVYVMTPHDHNGLDNRARMMVRIDDGKWVLVK